MSHASPPTVPSKVAGNSLNIRAGPAWFGLTVTRAFPLHVKTVSYRHGKQIAAGSVGVSASVQLELDMPHTACLTSTQGWQSQSQASAVCLGSGASLALQKRSYGKKWQGAIVAWTIKAVARTIRARLAGVCKLHAVWLCMLSPLLISLIRAPVMYHI
jgi:hypothetical protein